MRTVALAAMRLEAQLLLRDKAYVVLTLIASLGFLALVSMFGLTASDVPMALVVDDRGPYTRPFVEALVEVPHAFRLTRMSAGDAERLVARGDLVGVIRIPPGFSKAIARGDTVPIEVELDNVNVDIVADVQRALPAAIVGFGHAVGFPGLRANLVEHDVYRRDTSFLPYITVSGIGLVALVIASVLAALAVAREWESRTWRLWRLSPASSIAVLAGKLATTALVSLVAVGITTLVVVFAYGAVPAHPFSAALGVIAAILCFSCLGALLGALLRRSLVLVPLVFGLAMPLYIDSGALEPTRFDGETLFAVAHVTPLYYVVGWLDWAFFDLRITPEPPWSLLLFIAVLGALAFVGAAGVIARWSARRT